MRNNLLNKGAYHPGYSLAGLPRKISADLLLREEFLSWYWISKRMPAFPSRPRKRREGAERNTGDALVPSGEAAGDMLLRRFVFYLFYDAIGKKPRYYVKIYYIC